MVKYYCDVCNEEIRKGETNYVDERLEHVYHCITISVMVAISGVWSKGHLCKKCLIEVFRSFIRSFK